jgi:hypothetical protein
MLGGALGPKLVIQVLTDATKGQQGLKDAASTAGKLEQGIGKLAGPALGALGALALLGGGAAAAASDTEQAFGALESVYKDNADAAKAMAKSASTDVGLAASEYAQIAAILGAQLKNAGTAADDLAPAADNLIRLGADLAATFGGTTADAVAAVSSLLRGERDPIEKYGVAIKQADVNARLAAQGLDKLEGEAKRTAEAQATLALLTEQTADAQGAFARESDTAAHATQVAEASWKDAGAAIGQALLPVVVLLSGALADVAKWAGENAPLIQAVAVVVGILATAILAVNVALTAYKAITTVVTAAQWLLNAALTANPIGIVVLAIAALVAALVLLWQNSETFREIVTGAFEAVQAVVGAVVGAIIGFFQRLVATIRAVFAPVLRILSGPISAFGDLVRSVVGLVAALFRVVLSVVVGVMGRFADVLLAPIRAWLAVVKSVLAIVGDLFRQGLAVAQGIFATLARVLAKPFNDLLGVVKAVFGAIRKIVQNAADFIAGIFRKIKGVVDKITSALNGIPKVSLPFMVPAPPAGVAGPSTFGARAGTRSTSAAASRTVTLVLDGQVFGRATIGALRTYDRRNGPAQVIPRWS